MNILLLAAVFTLGVQFAGFIVAAAWQTEVFYDVWGGLNFLSLAGIGWFTTTTTQHRPLILIIMTVLFCISRGWLLVFLAWRAHNRKGDSRFDNVKNHPLLFFVYWMVQACWVYLVSMPLLIMQRNTQESLIHNATDTNTETSSISILECFLLVGFGASIYLEISSDVQKTLWVERGRVGGFCTEGWWHYSRHPNYAGEILQWWFAAVIAVVSSYTDTSTLSDPNLSWLGLVSPLFTMQILLAVPGTGVWHAEGKNLKRYYESTHHSSENSDYRETTSPVWPMPPTWYAGLSLPIKRWILLEWERYEYKPSSSSSRPGSPS